MTIQTKTQQRITWGLRILLAVVFLAAGLSKLAGVAQMVQVFDAIGIGQWFRYVTGAVEVTGAVLLLVPSLGLFGALLLCITMICAIGTHLLVIGGNPVPAIVLGLLSGAVAYRLRSTNGGATTAAVTG